MGVIICRPGEGVYALQERGRSPVRILCPFSWPCVPCASAECLAFCCQHGRECLCIGRSDGRVISRMPAVPGICEMRFSVCGRFLYQLSSEADCVHTRCALTGELLYAAPAGVFPRCMKLSPQGNRLLCAGGASTETVLLSAPELKEISTVITPHPCLAGDFWQDGLVLVCAAEEGDIQSIVYTFAPEKRSMQEVLRFPGLPGNVCVCDGGRCALLSARSGLIKTDLHTGRILWKRPQCALAMKLECCGRQTLVSDALDGSVVLLDHRRPWQQEQLDVFAEAQACFL